MGHYNFHAVLVTISDYDNIAQRVRDQVSQWFEPNMVSAFGGDERNYKKSFTIFPSSSKEGWDTANNHIHNIERALAYFDTYAYEDGSTPVTYVWLSYGDNGVNIMRSTEHDRVQGTEPDYPVAHWNRKRENEDE